MALYYEILEDGYYIKDDEQPLMVIHQYEPFIPYPDLGYEGSAQKQIEDLTIKPEETELYQMGYDQAILDMLEESEVI